MKLSISINILGFLFSVPTCMVVSGFQVLAPNRNHILRPSQDPCLTNSLVLTTTTMATTTTTTRSNSHWNTPTALHIFGGLFGGGGSKVSLSEEALTIYSRTTTTNAADDDQQQFEALGDYIEKWSKLFTNGNIKLTTPVMVELVPSNEARRGVRLLFKDTATGYKSKTEEQESNAQSTTSSQDANKDKKQKQASASKVKQGGVEILVEKNNNGIQVTAKRCEIEEDTIIKEMSEETILNELKQAIEVWKRETKQ